MFECSDAVAAVVANNGFSDLSFSLFETLPAGVFEGLTALREL